jgi:cytochrome P450
VTIVSNSGSLGASSPSGPTADIDIFSEDNIRDPHPAWATLRELGSVVYLSKADAWLVTCYAEARSTLADWQTFSSAGPAVYGAVLGSMVGETVLTTDPPLHDTLRGVLSEQTSPRAVKKLTADIMAHADELVAEAVEADSIEAIEALCKRMPVDTVADLIGLPQEGRDGLLAAADRMLLTFSAPDRSIPPEYPTLEEVVGYLVSVMDRDVLKPDGWGAAILDAVDDGRIGPEHAVPLLSSYVFAGMGTTVHALGFYLNNLAQNPSAWAALKADPALIGSGLEETMRLDGPAQAVKRATTRDVELGEHSVPAGSRVIVAVGSANRDSRKYPDPDKFDIHRNPVDHLGFGYATHGCVGQGLARLEVRAVISALLRRVSTLEPEGPREMAYPIAGFSGIARLPIKLTREKEKA